MRIIYIIVFKIYRESEIFYC